MEDHVPRHAQMGAWVLINDRWYNARLLTDRKGFLGELLGRVLGPMEARVHPAEQDPHHVRDALCERRRSGGKCRRQVQACRRRRPGPRVNGRRAGPVGRETRACLRPFPCAAFRPGGRQAWRRGRCRGRASARRRAGWRRPRVRLHRPAGFAPRPPRQETTSPPRRGQSAAGEPCGVRAASCGWLSDPRRPVHRRVARAPRCRTGEEHRNRSPRPARRATPPRPPGRGEACDNRWG